MNVRINGKEEVLPDGQVDLRELVIRRGLAPERVIIEYNAVVVPREQWPILLLQDGDQVEIVSFVGGG